MKSIYCFISVFFVILGFGCAQREGQESTSSSYSFKLSNRDLSEESGKQLHHRGTDQSHFSRRGEVLDLQLLPHNPNTRNRTSEPSNWDLRLPIEKMVSENDIQIVTTLVLRELYSDEPSASKNLFLAWPANFRGQVIASAQFTHRVELPEGEYSLSHQRQVVLYDSERQIFFIPVSALFDTQYTIEDVDPSHLQLIRLDLILADGSTQVINIRFRMCGPLPHLRQTIFSPFQRRGVEELIHTIKHDENIELFEETIGNPTGRALHLWVRSYELGSSAQVRSYVDFRQAEVGAHAELAERRGRKTYITPLKWGPLDVSRRLQNHQDTTHYSESLIPGQWMRYEMRPYEVFTLKWRVRRGDSLTGVHLPASIRQRVLVSREALPMKMIRRAQVLGRQNILPGQILSADLFHCSIFEDIDTHHHVVGADLRSGLPREIRVGFGFREPAGLLEGPEWDLQGEMNALRNFKVISQPIEQVERCFGDCTNSQSPGDVYQQSFIH
ncbi:hypothetical protein EBS43_09625 [bacterium]|jgi:hypothetical protein|nr:hypothetical protein [bacterium]